MPPAGGQAPPGKRAGRDIRVRVAALAVLCVALGGAALHWFGRDGSQSAGGGDAPIEARGGPAAHARAKQRAEFDQRFGQAVIMLHARQYEHAVTALHRLLEIAPEVPEVHVNMGFALLGMHRQAAARDFFLGATQLRPQQANAYYGLAIALEGLGDRPGALGAMRTFVHLAAPGDPWLPKARAALWEWQAGPSR